MAAGGALTLAALACRDATPPPPPAPDVVSVELRGPDTLRVGTQARLTLVLRDSLGARVEVRPQARWYLTTRDSALRLTPDGDGARVEGVRRGYAQITVLSHAAVGRRTIEVRPVPARVGSVTVEGPAALTVGEEQRMGVVVRDAAGNRLGWGDTPAGYVEGAAWELTPPGVVSFVLTASQAGVVRGLRPGVVQVRATVNGVTGTLAIHVGGAP